ncbi:MAG: hypothetical protein B6244_11455 [Candidatus Cloacimonetes bacterium 4572_55]|nr:MAG: hypothetical protein B6244_11455 [Candidatus Cloacimonetes bacterium 4572_55]
MKNRIFSILLMALLCGLFVTASNAQIYVHPSPSHHHSLEIDVWMDQPEGSVYFSGEEIAIYFRANQDCYVTLYNVDTEGYIHRLWPTSSYEDNFVYGHRTYRIPDRYDRYELKVSGMSGIEYIQAVASRYPYEVPHFRFRDPARYDAHQEWDVSFGVVWGDPFTAINKINRYCVPDRHWNQEAVSVDMTYFYVDQYVYYPRTLCSDCHWRGSHIDHRHGPHFDPYHDSCPEFVFYVDVDYRYACAPSHSRYHGKYRYKKRSSHDRHRIKKHYRDRNRDGRYRYKYDAGKTESRYKKGGMNMETPPVENPPAKHIYNKTDRNRYTDRNPEKKYDSRDKKIKSSDNSGSSRFQSGKRSNKKKNPDRSKSQKPKSYSPKTKADPKNDKSVYPNKSKFGYESRSENNGSNPSSKYQYDSRKKTEPDKKQPEVRSGSNNSKNHSIQSSSKKDKKKSSSRSSVKDVDKSTDRKSFSGEKKAKSDRKSYKSDSSKSDDGKKKSSKKSKNSSKQSKQKDDSRDDDEKKQNSSGKYEKKGK